MPFIEYDKKEKKFVATKKRPNNQSSKKTLMKLARRLSKYIVEHPDTELTILQERFLENFAKKAKAYKLTPDDINIAHTIAISRIINYFVKILNDPDSLHVKHANDFADATLSSASSNDDKGRDTVRVFLQDVKNESGSKSDRCKQANKIITILNCSTRNLNIGYASVNKAIQDDEDPGLVNKKGYKDIFIKRKDTRTISKNWNKLADKDDTGPQTKKTKDGKKTILSSSVAANKKDSYIRANSSDSSSDSETPYLSVPANRF